jgi:hypothetical protein
MTSFQPDPLVSPNPSTTAICIDGTCDAGSATTLTFTVESSGILAAGGQVYNNPFLADFAVYVRQQTDFYGFGWDVLHRLNASVGITAKDAGTVRTWTYNVLIAGTEIGTLFTCPAPGTLLSYPNEEIYLIGVASNGQAMRLSTGPVSFDCQ